MTAPCASAYVAGDTGSVDQLPRSARPLSTTRGVRHMASVIRCGPECQTRLNAFLRSHSLTISSSSRSVRGVRSTRSRRAFKLTIWKEAAYHRLDLPARERDGVHVGEWMVRSFVRRR